MITKFRIFEELDYDDYSWGDHDARYNYGYEKSKPTYKKTDEDKIRTWDEEGIDFFYNYNVKNFIDLLKRGKLHIDKFDNQILEYSIIEDELELFKELMKYQKMELTFEDNYLLRKSVRVGNVEFVKELLKYYEVDPTANNDISIRTASENGNIKVVKLLLKDKRVNPTTYNNYALIKSITNRHIDIANLLLDDERVNPGIPNIDPLACALYGHHNDLVDKIMKYKEVLIKIDYNYIKGYTYLYNYAKRNPNILKYINITDEEKRKLFPVYKSKKIDRSI